MTGDLLFVSLVPQRKIEIKCGKAKRTFDPNNIEALGEFLSKHLDKQTMCTSSVNHPKESGFKDSFDIGPIFEKAREYAQRKVALTFDPISLAEAPDVLEKAIGAYPKGFPTPVLFTKTGKDGSDVLFVFYSEGDVQLFLSGLRYGRHLAALTNG